MGWWPGSTAAAAIPVLVLLGLLASGKASAWAAAVVGLLTAAAVAIGVFGMPPDLVLASAGVGVVFAAFRIIWLIVAAVFLYDLAVQTGQFDVMKASVARLSGDRRIQAVLVAFSFGAFIEGAAGFGAPVAISAAFLVGLGFRPFQAALLCLIANTAPVAWGAIGTPILTLSKVTGLDVNALSATSGRILPPLSLIIPFWLVRSMTGWRETFAVWPALLVVGGTFAGVQFLWSNWVGFELVDIASAVASMVAGVLLLRRPAILVAGVILIGVPFLRPLCTRWVGVDLGSFVWGVGCVLAALAVLRYWKPRGWQPRDEWRFAHDSAASEEDAHAAHHAPLAPVVELTAGRVVRAWMPFALLTATVLVWGLPAIKPLGTPAVKEWLDAYTSWKPAMPRLHEHVAKGEAVTGRATPDPKLDYEKAPLDLVPISSTGTAVFLAAVLSGLYLGVGPAAMAQAFGRTLRRMVPAIVAIVAMLALGFVTKYSGMDAVLGLAFTRTGPVLYPVFGTLLGWLGVALTGSDTSSNVLFGNLQRITARKLGLSEVLMASANTTGGVMGKMIDAQSIVVAAAATGEGGKEGDLLRAVLGHSLALALLVGAIVWVYARLLPWVVVEVVTAG
jgi:lactate permease